MLDVLLHRAEPCDGHEAQCLDAGAKAVASAENVHRCREWGGGQARWPEGWAGGGEGESAALHGPAWPR